MPADEHREIAKQEGAVPVAVVTVSDTRTEETDTSGKLIKDLLTGQGHIIADYRIVKDEPDQISALMDELTSDDHPTPCRIIIFNGGTGIAPRDTTYDAIAGRLEKVMPGFGEIFRMLSYQEVGAAAMLSRAIAGTYRGRVIFSTPGSSNAVRVAMEHLILPELQHIAWEIMR